MSKEQIEKAIKEFVENPDRPKMYMDNKLSVAKWGKALAEHIAANLPPSVDEVVELAKQALDSEYVELIVDSMNSGAIRSVEPLRPVQINWPASSSLGKDILAAIKSAMLLEPTVDEAAELDATLGEMVEALGKHNEQQKLPFATLTIFSHGGGSVRDGNGILFHWPNSDNPGNAAVKAIQAHTKPEPTAKEKALAALEHIVFTAGASVDVYAPIIREALEAE